MSELVNLGLDFVDGKSPQGKALARIYIDSAVSYRKEDGAIVITKECESVEKLGAEIARLKRELGEIVKRAERGFAGKETVVAEDQPVEAAQGRAPAKVQIEIDHGLVVGDRMTQPVATVRRNDKLSLADTKFRNGGFRHLVVIDDDSDDIVGVLSQRQVALSAIDWVMGHGVAAYERMISTTPVKEVMETQVKTIARAAPLSEAAALLAKHKIGCLPVMENDQLVGIVTEGDFVEMLRDATVRGVESEGASA
ncbi:MAG: CBS domain-containing protein [bacterium]|nr:CBS domain-containing protein [bacterium]